VQLRDKPRIRRAAPASSSRPRLGHSFDCFLYCSFFPVLFSVYRFLRCMFIHAARGASHPTAAGRAKSRHPVRTYTQARATRVLPVGDAPRPTVCTTRCRPPAAGRPWSGPEPTASAVPHPHRQSPPRASVLVGPRRGVGATSGGGASTRTSARGTTPASPSPRQCLCTWRTRRFRCPRMPRTRG